MTKTTQRILIQFVVIALLVFCFQCEDWLYLILGKDMGWKKDMAALFSEKIFHGLYMREPDITILLNAMMPIILFSVLYGSFIYDDLQGTGIYYFIRYQRRATWFCKKVTRLLWCAFVFQTAYVGIQYVCCLIMVGEAVTWYNLKMLLSYTIYLTVLCFMLVLLTNILAVRFGRVIAFIVAYTVLVVMRWLILSVGNAEIPGIDLKARALIPMNLTLDENGCFAADTYFSLTVTFILCCFLIIIFYRLIKSRDVGLIMEEKHI